MTSMNLPEKLERLLARPGIRAIDVARKAGLRPQRITEWKDPKSKRRPTLTQALALAQALDVPLDYLADDAQDDPPAPDVPPDLVALIRTLGVERARARLLMLPEPGSPPIVVSPDAPSYGDVPPLPVTGKRRPRD